MNFVAHIPKPFTVVDLLIKLAVIALLAGFIARFSMFRRLLMIEQRGPREKIQFAAFLGLPFMIGVWPVYLPVPTTDLSLEVTVVAGLLGGTIVGLAVALIVCLPILAITLWTAVLTFFPALTDTLPIWMIPHYRPELLADPLPHDHILELPGSSSSRSSGKSTPRSLSGVQSVYCPTIGPR